MRDEAETERKRLLRRLAAARQAATKQHEPRWFNFHPQVQTLFRYRYMLHWAYGALCTTMV